MFKKTMTFDDLNGEEVEQTFYFNYNMKEIAELLEFGHLAQFVPTHRRLPLEEQLKILTVPVEESGLTQQENNQQGYDIFQGLILDAYGEKGADNVTFVKNTRTREYFASHVAFVEMIFEFLEKPQLAAQFIENCLPEKKVAEAKKELQKENAGKLSGATLTEMVAEAERRQKDPATRIEPGITPDMDPAMVQAAEAIANDSVVAGTVVPQEPPTPVERKQEDLTPDEIMNMPQATFQSLDPRRFNKEQMLAAFKRKSSTD